MQVSTKLKDTVLAQGGQVVFGAHVKQIQAITSESQDMITNVVCSDGKTYVGKIVVSAGCASKFLRDCAFTQRLPGDVSRFANTTYRGAYAKAVLVYETTWWRTAGFSGFVTNTKPSAGRCVAFGYDYTGVENAFVCFICGDLSAQIGAMPEEERKKSVLSSMELFFPDHKEALNKVIMYKDEYWQHNEFSGGGPMTVYAPGFFERYSAMKVLRDGLVLSGASTPTLLFAGTDVSARWSGYMEGACLRGQEVALDVLNSLEALANLKSQPIVDEHTRWNFVAKEG